MCYNKRRKLVFQDTEQSIKMSKKEEECEEYPVRARVLCWKAFVVLQTKCPLCSWVIRQVERLDTTQHALCITAFVQTQGNGLQVS